MSKLLTNKNSFVYGIVIIIFICILYILTIINSQMVDGVEIDIQEERNSEIKNYFEKIKYLLNPYEEEQDNQNIKNDLIHGDVIMPELGDPVVRAELGRSTWNLLHTMAGRFPENPTKEESEAFSQFVYLTARLYPCGDCAKHFQKILEKLGPQTETRDDASKWICNIHNGANKFLKKEIFDCDKVAKRWPCYKCEESKTNKRRFEENIKFDTK